MAFSFDRWRRRLFLLGCAGYWTILVVVLLGPPIIAGWRVTRPDAGHGVINGSLDGTMIHVTMSSTHTAPWSGSIGLGALALWILGPPLVLWLALRGLRQSRSATPIRSSIR